MSRHSTNILVIDDDLDQRSSLCQLLREMGHRTTEVASANEGLQLLRTQEAFDLVLTDVVMPETNGIEFAKLARSARLDIKIVLVTGDAGAVEDVIAGGAIAILKPYSYEALSCIISEAVHRSTGGDFGDPDPAARNDTSPHD